MEKIFILICLLVLPILISAQSGSTKIDVALDELMSAHPNDYHGVLIFLKDQVDTRALLIKYENEKTPLAQRSNEVITSLQQKVVTTQPSVLALLDQTEGVEKGSAATLWLVNLIYVRATAHAIAQISTWEEVQTISFNTTLQNETISSPQFTPSSPNGTETGLRVIKAPFMWAKGYTGYGRKGLVIDTGQDGDHPALLANFWGNHVPKEQAWHSNKWPEDCANHGSHVTGTMVGLDRKTNDTIGVAYNAHWMGAPMFSLVDTSGLNCTQELDQTVYAVLNSLQWALNPDNDASTITDQPDCINNSWTSSVFNCNTVSSINTLSALEAVGIAVVFAQGNSGPTPGTVSSTAAINVDLVNTFAVGAVDGSDPSLKIADFSSRGPSPCGASGPLLIKPEVTAPGVNVRSSYNNGEYASISGTSMAAPHTAGALLLLKEAFPYLSGTQLKLALYNSAVDLGTAGEDNNYGKGIINIEAAFNLLVSQGNTPVPPVAFNHDAILADLSIPQSLCIGGVEYTIGLENGGNSPITSIEFTYGIENGVTQTYTWTGNLTTNMFINLSLPPMNNITPGTYTAFVTITAVNGQPDDRLLNNQIKRPFTMFNDQYASVSTNILQSGLLCSGSRVLLNYDTDLASNEVPQWYASATGGTVLSEGTSFLTPALSQNTTYYVTSVANYNVGKESATGTSSNTTGGALRFSVYKGLRLKTVKVVADETGERIIELLNNFEQVIETKIINLTQTGEQRIALNFNLPEGAYALRLAGGKELKETNNSGFPHAVTGIISIYNGFTPTWNINTLRYFYFYDWEIEVGLVCGRTAVPVSVSPSPTAPTVNFETNPAIVVVNTPTIFNDLTPGATAQYWDFGNQQTSTEAQPSVTYTALGDYKVYLISKTANGCSNYAEKTITVTLPSGTTDISDFEHKATLFPNPNDGSFAIRFGAAYAPENGDVQVFDMLGRAVLTQRNAVQQATVQVEAASLTPGVYFVQITENGELRWIGRFVKK